MASFRLASLALAVLLTGCATLETGADHVRDFAGRSVRNERRAHRHDSLVSPYRRRCCHGRARCSSYAPVPSFVEALPCPAGMVAFGNHPWKSSGAWLKNNPNACLWKGWTAHPEKTKAPSEAVRATPDGYHNHVTRSYVTRATPARRWRLRYTLRGTGASRRYVSGAGASNRRNFHKHCARCWRRQFALFDRASVATQSRERRANLFFGFAFGRENVDRLQTRQIPQHIPIFCTTYGMTTGEVVDAVDSAFPQYAAARGATIDKQDTTIKRFLRERISLFR
jgi:hypothetical protein